MTTNSGTRAALTLASGLIVLMAGAACSGSSGSKETANLTTIGSPMSVTGAKPRSGGTPAKLQITVTGVQQYVGSAEVSLSVQNQSPQTDSADDFGSQFAVAAGSTSWYICIPRTDLMIRLGILAPNATASGTLTCAMPTNAKTTEVIFAANGFGPSVGTAPSLTPDDSVESAVWAVI